MSASVTTLRAADLLERLRRHYVKRPDFPGGVFVPEVGINIGNGGGQQRRCDAIHVGFTGSSGQLLTGHEIKISRSDWLAELDHPEKSAWWAEQCHRWYVVTPRGLVKEGELPPGWGLIEAPPAGQVKRLAIKREAPIFADRVPSWDVCRSIMARVDTLASGDRAKLASAERDAKSARAAALSARDAPAAVERTHDQKWADDLLAEIRRLGDFAVLHDRPALIAAARDLAEAHIAAARTRDQLLRLSYIAAEVQTIGDKIAQLVSGAPKVAP